MSASEASTRRRVKLYILNDERQWDDRGTGHVSAMVSENKPMSLVVISETDGSLLLESRIQTDTAYQKQQETLIVWSEGENSDLALSFQEKTGCDDIWEKICHVQGKDPSVEITQELNDDTEESEEIDTENTTPYTILNSNLFELPTCELTKLADLVDLFHGYISVRNQREQLANAVLDRGSTFLYQLINVFHKAEDANDEMALHHIYDLAKQLLSLNNANLYTELFSPSIIMELIGMLEFTPNERKFHRIFFKDKAAFKDICELDDKELIDKIHQTYQVQFIQECCMSPPSLLDENSTHHLNNFLQQNKGYILRYIINNDALIKRLFIDLMDDELADEGKKRELTAFLRELCFMCNSLIGPEKDSFLHRLLHVGLNHNNLSTSVVVGGGGGLVNSIGGINSTTTSSSSGHYDSFRNGATNYRTSTTSTINGTVELSTLSSSTSSSSLASSSSSSVACINNKEKIDRNNLPPGGLLGVLKRLLRNTEDIQIRHHSLDMLNILVETHCNVVRDFLFNEHSSVVDDEDLLFNILTDQMISDTDPEGSYTMTISLMMKTLIDPDSMMGNSFTQLSGKTEFVSFLIRRVMSYLCQPLLNNTEGDSLINDDYHTALVMYHLLEIISFCIDAHSHSMKNFITQRQLFGRIALLLRSKHTFLVLAVVRFFRRLLQLKDEFYNRTFIRFNLFHYLVETFVRNGDRYNLLNSALVELFDFVQNESIICLIQEMGRQGHLDQLAERVHYVDTFRTLKQRYDAMIRRQPPPQTTTTIQNSNITNNCSTSSSLISLSGNVNSIGVCPAGSIANLHSSGVLSSGSLVDVSFNASSILASSTSSSSSSLSSPTSGRLSSKFSHVQQQQTGTLSSLSSGLHSSLSAFASANGSSNIHNNNNNSTSGLSSVGDTLRYHRDSRTLEDEEELWFNQEDDDEDEEEIIEHPPHHHHQQHHHHSHHHSHSHEQQRTLPGDALLLHQQQTSSDSEDAETDELIDPSSSENDTNTLFYQDTHNCQEINGQSTSSLLGDSVYHDGLILATDVNLPNVNNNFIHDSLTSLNDSSEVMDNMLADIRNKRKLDEDDQNGNDEDDLLSSPTKKVKSSSTLLEDEFISSSDCPLLTSCPLVNENEIVTERTLVSTESLHAIAAGGLVDYSDEDSSEEDADLLKIAPCHVLESENCCTLEEIPSASP